MFKENRIIFQGGNPEQGPESQGIEVDAGLKAVELERFVSRKGEILEKVQELLHKEGVTNANKIDGLKSLRARLAKYHDKNESAKYKGSAIDRGRIGIALFRVSEIINEVDAEIRGLEEPARADVKAETKDNLKNLKAGAPKFKEKSKPGKEQAESFKSAIKDEYSFLAYPANEYKNHLVIIRGNDFNHLRPGEELLPLSREQEARFANEKTAGGRLYYSMNKNDGWYMKASENCINALTKDIVRATGIQDTNAIKRVIVESCAPKPTTFVPGSPEELNGSYLQIEFGEGNPKRILFHNLWKAGLIKTK
ncbi:TPA: hypothetical protein DCZ16_04970 [Candidatus Peregrinibacteria bacterium]|nr:hypothetical protein [Candidatus Peregrinibacteria bacterium]